MTENNKYKADLGFLDMLFNMLMVFAMLFLLSYILIKAENAKKSVERKAEFIIEMTWPDKSFDDIDLHLMLPDKKQIDFTNKDVEYASLDRDDRGADGDTYTDANGKLAVIEVNKEVASIRAIVPGTYVVNVHMYRIQNTIGELHSDVSLPYPVKVKLIKINPTVSDIAEVEKIVDHVGQQVTAFSFTVDEKGNVTNVDKEDQILFIRTFDMPFQEVPDHR